MEIAVGSTVGIRVGCGVGFGVGSADGVPVGENVGRSNPICSTAKPAVVGISPFCHALTRA